MSDTWHCVTGSRLWMVKMSSTEGDPESGTVSAPPHPSDLTATTRLLRSRSNADRVWSHSSISSDRVRFLGDICADFQHCSLSNTETGNKEEKEEDAFPD